MILLSGQGGDFINKKVHTHLVYIFRLAIIISISAVLSLFLGNFGFSKESIIMVFLIGVLIITVVTSGYFYGITASVVSVLVFNYHFTVPVHTFIIHNSNDVVLMLVFLGASIISGTMTKRFQRQLLISKQNENTAKLLYKVTESFINVEGRKNILLNGINYIYQNTNHISRVILSDSNEVFIDNSREFNTDNKEIIEFPIKGLSKQIGIMQVICDREGEIWEHELLIKAVTNQMGLFLDREYIRNERENICMAMEREKMRSNLLRSISHDLRTPLTGIIGASGVILENIDQLETGIIEKLVLTINDEANWLNNLVENILNMTKIEEGKLVINKNHEVVDDVVYEAISHVSKLSQKRSFNITVPDEVITVLIDGKLIVQVLINLLENAIKYTEDDGNICIRVYPEDNNIIFEVEDDGTGIDNSIKDLLFEGFVTQSSKVIDGRRSMGLGLSICKAIVEAHGGCIFAENIITGGALFKFSIPFEEDRQCMTAPEY